MKKNNTTLLSMQLFWQTAKKYNQFLYPLLIVVPITVVMGDIIQPYIVSKVLNMISTGAYNPNDLWGSFKDYLILYIFSTFGWGVIGWRLNIFLIWKLEMNAVRDLNNKVFSHLINMSANFHANRFGGSLVSQTNKLTGAYVKFADSTIFSMVTLLVSLTATVAVLAPKVPLYAAVLLCFTLLFISGTILLTRIVRATSAEEAAAQTKQTGKLADAITNIMAIKSFSRLDYEKKRFRQASDLVVEKTIKNMKATTLRETFASTITSSITIAALFIAVLGVKYFDANIATLFLIVSYTMNISMRLWEFQHVLRQYNRAFGDAAEMTEILQIEPEIKDPEKPEEVKISRGAIKFNNVTFSYSDNKEPLFKNLNIRIRPGEKIGLVGHSGGGKTTLTQLLLRFMDIQDGKIEIDNQDISKIKQDDLRSKITYVAQEPMLFHRTLFDNIAYGDLGADQKTVVAVAKMAHAHEFINKLPDKYETLVGERGVKLSGGQRQRVAIARAMIKNAPILVLDEATSALDSESEVLIQDALWKLMDGKTAIVIAHRLSTIQKMDRIIVLDNGKVIEEGSHKQLIRQKGKYAELWAHQSGGFLE